MRIELYFLLITLLVIYNIYTDGKYLKLLLSMKKYYQMAGVALGSYMLYWLIKKDPTKASQIVKSTNEYLKYMPIDKDTSNVISPFLNFTSSQYQDGGSTREETSKHVLMNSGKKGTKRSVSETKKKYVASNQNWKCGNCKQQLSAWFEVDHKTRLEYGGSNHVDNLVALCRECHGEKTAMENM
jgi:uncharacterized membrane protein